jgi:hypothetical protein
VPVVRPRPVAALLVAYATGGLALAAGGLVGGGLLSGCFIDEATAPRPPVPGGAVVAQLNGGAMKTATALAHFKATPPVIDGASNDVTISITVGDDAGGGDASALLATAGGHTTLNLSPTSRSHLEVHASGAGCVATSGVVHLDADAHLAIEGDFAGQGSGCTIAGTLMAIPVDR